ncbi:hypothetical protein ES708_08988 [subsurface metagenome]
MYHLTLITDLGEVKLKTTERIRARALKLLAQENDLVCEVVVETKPREVKFKGVD